MIIYIIFYIYKSFKKKSLFLYRISQSEKEREIEKDRSRMKEIGEETEREKLKKIKRE